MTEYLKGGVLKGMFINAAANLANNRVVLNDLNVFPVPDGDTGTNMFLTADNAVKELGLRRDSEPVGEISNVISSALLRGARGNSGVILSLLFRGFSRRLRDLESCSPEIFAEALIEGVDAAYKSVLHPAEGTILTVSRRASRAAADVAAKPSASIEKVLEGAIKVASETLAATTDMNPVLKKAGVVDAGGKGYVYILEGMLDYLEGRVIEREQLDESETRVNVFAEFNTEDITFGYCTELIIIRENDKDPVHLESFMDEIGDSAVLVADEEYIKIHVHSNNPGLVLEEALAYGALTTIKVENMREQHSQLTSAVPEPAKADTKPVDAEKKYGFVSVAVGRGICEVFKDLGVDRIVDGGQTMNPSTDDILAAVNSVPAEIVFVFPNNKNIILAAEQAVPLCDKRIIVIPTASVTQGISAMIGFDPDLEAEENRDIMLEIFESVHYGQITEAARDAVYDDRSIKKGDHLCLVDGKLISSGKGIKMVMKRMLRSLKLKDASFITVFHGEGHNDEDLENLMEMIRRDSGSLTEIKSISGGQPLYSYIISVE